MHNSTEPTVCSKHVRGPADGADPHLATDGVAAVDMLFPLQLITGWGKQPLNAVSLCRHIASHTHRAIVHTRPMPGWSPAPATQRSLQLGPVGSQRCAGSCC